MSDPRYPNESREYREARDSLVKDEQELVDKVKSVAARRRPLPLGGQLKENYTFQWANDGKMGEPVKFSELFGTKNTLLLCVTVSAHAVTIKQITRAKCAQSAQRQGSLKGIDRRAFPL